MNFKVFVIMLFIVVLIVTSVLTYYSMRKELKSRGWPPIVSKCPDYWALNKDENGEENICKNTKNLGRVECSKTIDLNTFIYNSKLLADDDCTKAQWARTCDLTWDGITNKENICD
jgi:hypothetical protein